MRHMNTIRNTGRWAIIAAILGCWFTACAEDTDKDTKKDVVRPAKIFVVGDNGNAAQRQFPGTVRAAQQVDMSFNFAGTLTKLPIKEGDNVKKGQLLARIDARDYRNAVAAERAKLAQSKASFERHKQLVIDEVTTPAEFDRVQRMYEVQKVAVKIAEKALGDTTLTAPFSGRIAKRYVDNFKEVQAKEPVVSVQDITSLEVLVDLPESIMAHVRRKGAATAVAEFSMLPGKKFELQTREVALQADPQTQTYQVVLAMPAPEELNILPGMTASVTATATAKLGASQSKASLVPVAAVFADEAGERFVWIVDQAMKVQKTKVEVGEVTGGRIQVTKGLKAGDRIVGAGVNYLEPGQLISELTKTGK